MALTDADIGRIAQIAFAKLLFDVDNHTGDYTLTTEDMGKVHTSIGASADIEFTLPAIALGSVLTNWVIFFNAIDFEMLITSPEGDNIIGFDNVAGDNVLFTTAANHIAAGVLMIREDVDGSWLALHFGPHTVSSAG